MLKNVDMVDLVFAIHAARTLRMQEFLDKALMLFQRFETLDGPKSWKALQAVRNELGSYLKSIDIDNNKTCLLFEGH